MVCLDIKTRPPEMDDATPPELKVYEIPAQNMPGLAFKLETLSKKSKKLLGKPLALNVLGEVRKPHIVQHSTRQRGVDADGVVSPHNDGTWVHAIDAEGNFIWKLFYR